MVSTLLIFLAVTVIVWCCSRLSLILFQNKVNFGVFALILLWIVGVIDGLQRLIGNLAPNPSLTALLPLLAFAFMLWVVAKIVPGFYIDDFTTAFFGALIISIVNWALSAVFKGSDGQYHVMTHHSDVPTGMKRVEGRVVDSDSRA